jgi:hypothetical protein
MVKLSSIEGVLYSQENKIANYVSTVTSSCNAVERPAERSKRTERELMPCNCPNSKCFLTFFGVR